MPCLRVRRHNTRGNTRDEDVQTSGEGRRTLYLPPDLYARADDDPHANKDFSLDDVDVGIFHTMMCECRNYGLMVYLVALAVIVGSNGTVGLDVVNSNLELFAALRALLPRYDAATTRKAKGTVERKLILCAIQASKETHERHAKAVAVFPGFIAPGAYAIQNELNCAVVPEYGYTRTLVDSSGGDGARTKFVQFGYAAGEANILTKDPPAVVRVNNYALDYEGKEQPTESDIFNLIVSSIIDGENIVSDVKPAPVKCARSAVVLFTAAAPFLPAKFAPLARSPGFGDSETALKCGPGTWDDRIRAFRLYCLLVFAAQVYQLRVVVPDRKRERDAAKHVSDWCGTTSKQQELHAQFVKLVPPGGLRADDRRKVVDLIETGISSSAEASALLKTVEADASLCVLYYYVWKQLEELGAPAHKLVEPRVRAIVGDDRYEKSVAYSEARVESDHINIATVDLTYATYSARLESLKAAAARVQLGRSFEGPGRRRSSAAGAASAGASEDSAQRP